MNDGRNNAIDTTFIVDLFAGPGGLDVASTWLGVPSVGIEWDRNACLTRRSAGLATVQGDVRAYGPADFPHATVLAGGPPCQTFTVAGGGAGRRALKDVLDCIDSLAQGGKISGLLDQLDDERTGLVLEPLRWILEAERAGVGYKTVVLEQVPAVMPVWDAMAGVLADHGYFVVTDVLRAEEYGVPQTRRRALLIASKRPVSMPKPTHRRYQKGLDRTEGDHSLHPWTSMGDVLVRPQPFEVVSNYGTGGDPKKRGRRSNEHPSATVTGKISRNRIIGSSAGSDRFSTDEAGRLQTFPAKFPWSGSDIAQQVGNAIPPRLAAHVLAAALRLRIPDGSLDAVVASVWDANSPQAIVGIELCPHSQTSLDNAAAGSAQLSLC